MSTSILKKSLELFNTDLPESGNKSTVGKRKKNTFGNGAKKKKKLKLVLDEMKKKQCTDFTKTNLQFLRKLSHSSSTTPSVEKIASLQRLQGKKKKLKKPQKEKSIFSEEDFEKFEREYFVKS